MPKPKTSTVIPPPETSTVIPPPGSDVIRGNHEQMTRDLIETAYRADFRREATEPEIQSTYAAMVAEHPGFLLLSEKVPKTDRKKQETRKEAEAYLLDKLHLYENVFTKAEEARTGPIEDKPHKAEGEPAPTTDKVVSAIENEMSALTLSSDITASSEEELRDKEPTSPRP